jgi:CRP-like cAMP-binding protein
MTETQLDILHDHVRRRIQLPREECTGLGQYFTSRVVRTRQFLLQAGEVCRQIAFITDGCLRMYTVDHKGDEHVLQFAIRDWWISDLNSFLSGEPSTHFIDALQDSEVLLLDKGDRDALLESIPAMEKFFRLLLEANYIARSQRIADSLSRSAEERYVAFLKTYPTIAEQIPQAQIASFLGITPQSLSRIRKDLSTR